MKIDLEKIRAATPGCLTRIHLNNAGSSLMNEPTINAIKQHIDLEAEIGGYEAADSMANKIGEFYTEGAKLLNCRPENIAFTTNATDSYSRALSAIHFQENDVILTSSNDYISNFIAFISLRKRYNIQIIILENKQSGEINLSDLRHKLKAYQPKLVAITHVPTNSGLVQPVEKIGEIIAEFDSLYLVDACQSLGQLDLDTQLIKCHFLSGTMRKFLRGPRGAGILYVSDEALDRGFEPLFIDMRGGRWISPKQYNTIHSAKRFEDWEFAYALVLGSAACLHYCNELGINSIIARNNQLLSYAVDKLNQNKNSIILDKGKQKCNIITLKLPNQDAQSVMRHLHERSINTSLSFREYAIIDFAEKNTEWALRISPHYFNTKNEIDKLAQALAAI